MITRTTRTSRMYQPRPGAAAPRLRRAWIGRVACGLVTLALILAALAAPTASRAQTPDPSGTSRDVASIFFNSLSFGTSPDGPAIANFPAGTTQVYARFNYTGVPLNATLMRQWYLNGQPYLTRSDVWNPAWGSDGRLGGISIYDFQSGLPAGSYYVVISLVGYPNSPIVGSFSIDSTIIIPPTPVYTPPMAFTGLTASTSPAGADMTYFAPGTLAVYIRFNYTNIPVGTVLRREWYKDGSLYRVAEDVWSSYWGPTGRLTHIALYDYISGLPSGNWRVVAYLPSYPTVRAELSFVIGAGVPGTAYFSNLTFGTSVNSPAYSAFYAYTRQIFARWNYANAPVGAMMLRRWYRNGALWLERREPWYRSGAGLVYTSIYDFQFGLLPGNYYVEISLEGVPNSTVTGYFRVG